MRVVEVQLTCGKVAFVDEEDEPLVLGVSWQAVLRSGIWYAKRREGPSGGKTHYMHREIIGAPAGAVVDHIDRDGLNNSRSNLRIANRSQNRANAGPSVTSSTGLKGVFFDAFRRKWTAKIKVDGKASFLGRFQSVQEAVNAYDAAAYQAWGDFAYLNRDHMPATCELLHAQGEAA